MEKLINLPADIKAGTEIWVRDFDCEKWRKKEYVGQFGSKVYTVDFEGEISAVGWKRAKMPEVDWNDVPIGTAIKYWDGCCMKNDGYLVAVINSVPFCSPMPVEKFTQEGSNIFGGYTVQSWEHVELAEEEF